MVLIAVHPKYQKMGLNSVMMSRIIANVIEDKIERVESNPELVSNTAVQEQWNSMGRRIIKRRKTFSKKIGNNFSVSFHEKPPCAAKNRGAGRLFLLRVSPGSCPSESPAIRQSNPPGQRGWTKLVRAGRFPTG